MGRQSRAKRARREHATYLATVSNCDGTWLERPPDAEEQAKIDSAGKILRRFRMQALQLGADQEAFNRFSLELFRDERFTPLHFSDDLIDMILDEIGEPPIVKDEKRSVIHQLPVARVGGCRLIAGAPHDGGTGAPLPATVCGCRAV